MSDDRAAGAGAVVSVNISAEKGRSKTGVARAELRPDWGVVGDAHAAPGDRQVSLLAEEAISRFRDELASSGAGACPKAGVELKPGVFAENLTVRGLELSRLKPGTVLKVGAGAVLQVTRIGKECHVRCEIFKQVGRCVMPREGVFARVLKGGAVSPGDAVEVADAA